MPKQQTSRIYCRVPRRRMRFKSFLWLILGFSILSTGASGWTIALLNGTISSNSNFVGQLSPDADPIVITLPKGAILKEIHAPRNAEILQGQTVATLDSQAMTRRIEQLSAELLHDDMLRECLLVEELPETTFFVDLPQLAQDHARLAHQDCQLMLDEKDQIMSRMDKTKALKIEERSLVDHYISLLSTSLAQDLTPDMRDEDARQALALALLRNKLDLEIANMQFDAGIEGAEWQRDRIERIRILGEQIRTKTELRHHMEALLEQPRLQAPENGVVVQVRNVPRDTAMREDVEMMVLRPNDGIGYSASFVVPHHQLDMVSTGNKVQLTMLGMLDGGPQLTGEVTALTTTNQPAVRATITLDPESVIRLDDPQIGVALRGLGTASSIRVQKADLDAVGVLRSVLQNAFLTSGQDWFIQRITTPSETSDSIPVTL